jgi:hypothetical protein
MSGKRPSALDARGLVLSPVSEGRRGRRACLESGGSFLDEQEAALFGGVTSYTPIIECYRYSPLLAPPIQT